MTLEQLRIFVAVAERQHATRAAETLGLTQSAVSAAIAALERRYDVKFFHRVGRGIVLTEEGLCFLSESRSVLASVSAAEQALNELGGLKRGALRIHASQTVGGYWLPRYLIAYRAAYPGIVLSFKIGNTAEVAASVREGSADLGFVEGTVDDPVIRSCVVARDKLLLVVGANHPWAGRKRVQSSDFTRTSWILREKGSGTRAKFEEALKGLRITVSSLDVTLELPSNEAVRSAVISGTAATVLSASVVAAGLEAKLLHSIKFDLVDREFLALTHRRRYLSRSAKAFLERIGAEYPGARCQAP